MHSEKRSQTVVCVRPLPKLSLYATPARPRRDVYGRAGQLGSAPVSCEATAPKLGMLAPPASHASSVLKPPLCCSSTPWCGKPRLPPLGSSEASRGHAISLQPRSSGSPASRCARLGLSSTLPSASWAMDSAESRQKPSTPKVVTQRRRLSRTRPCTMGCDRLSREEPGR